MRCVVGIQVGLLSQRELKEQIADVVELVARQNALLIRKLGRKRIPQLFDSGLVYREEPWGPEFQHFPDAPTCIARGWVDCKGAVPWQLADLRLELPHVHFSVHVYIRLQPGGFLDMHLQIHRSDTNEIVDPSRLLQHS